MKILMFGWEFPPHISGGLGTACYGLTRGLAELKDVAVSFVVPKSFGDENQSAIRLIGANNVPVSKKELQFNNVQKKIEYYEVHSEIIPYVGEKEFWKLKTAKYTSPGSRFVETDQGMKINFSGEYGPNLIQEIKNYAVVAGIIARENEFDIIHAHDWLTYPAGIAAKKASGKPLVVHVHATDFDRSGGSVNPKIYSIEREGMEVADKVITVSNFTRRTVIQKYGISPKKITTIYNAVEPVTESSLNIRKGINERLVTFLGRITMQKGPEYFLEAAYLVLKKMENVRFIMAGSGDKMNEMVARVAELGIADKFHFTGFLKGDDVYHLFKMTDVFVMPSVSEPFGIVPLEAMQSDVPVIISNQSGVAEILKNAVKIDFWDTFSMADSIYGILNYPSLRHLLKESGKREVKNLKWKNSAISVRKLYQEVLNDVQKKIQN
ncbi:MAG: glycosyltransferase family 4 protein [Prolixibacteraceae bacterium]